MASQCASVRPLAGRRRDSSYTPAAPIKRTPPSPATGKSTSNNSPAWKKLKRFVRRGLTSKERLLITLHYCENLTLAEIGAVLEMPEARVAELHRNVLERVRTWVVGRKKTKVRVA
jgi:DNA-directed RNA polymerase specialized sigma24 family protein